MRKETATILAKVRPEIRKMADEVHAKYGIPLTGQVEQGITLLYEKLTKQLGG